MAQNFIVRSIDPHDSVGSQHEQHVPRFPAARSRELAAAPSRRLQNDSDEVSNSANRSLKTLAPRIASCHNAQITLDLMSIHSGGCCHDHGSSFPAAKISTLLYVTQNSFNGTQTQARFPGMNEIAAIRGLLERLAASKKSPKQKWNQPGNLQRPFTTCKQRRPPPGKGNYPHRQSPQR